MPPCEHQPAHRCSNIGLLTDVRTSACSQMFEHQPAHRCAGVHVRPTHLCLSTHVCTFSHTLASVPIHSCLVTPPCCRPAPTPVCLIPHLHARPCPAGARHVRALRPQRPQPGHMPPHFVPVHGTYVLSALEGHSLETSPHTLITCIVKVDLGGVCGDRSWVRPFADALGWTDAFLGRCEGC
eukprot:42494-Chlamydomonas_euryale.AAC.1